MLTRTHEASAMNPSPTPSLRAVRGEILHFLSDPATSGAAALQHFNDGINISLRNVLATVGDHAQKLSNLSWLASTQACSAVELIQSGLLSLV